MDINTTPRTELDQLERRMEKRWYDLAMAEQRGQPVHALERMYDAYIKALDDYIRYQRTHSAHPQPRRKAS
jgi:hypothetical protein